MAVAAEMITKILVALLLVATAFTPLVGIMGALFRGLRALRPLWTLDARGSTA